MAKLINGKEIANSIIGELEIKVKELKQNKNITPTLAVILVGEEPASQTYVRNKEKACSSIGIESRTYRFPANVEEYELISTIEKLNNDKDVHGILVQLPLPKNINEIKVLSKVFVEKDVDGFHLENMGKLFRGETPAFIACTPLGIMKLILSTTEKIAGKEAVVVGRSNIVGKPSAILLLNAGATVTICHSKTVNLKDVVRRGDIVVVAVGKPSFISGDMIKSGAIVVDVGINRTQKGLVGDVEFESAQKVASYITPVPGGVGPMTIAMLLENVVTAASRRGSL